MSFGQSLLQVSSASSATSLLETARQDRGASHNGTFSEQNPAAISRTEDRATRKSKLLQASVVALWDRRADAFAPELPYVGLMSLYHGNLPASCAG